MIHSMEIIEESSNCFVIEDTTVKLRAAGLLTYTAEATILMRLTSLAM
jgi:hypothetical protein